MPHSLLDELFTWMIVFAFMLGAAYTRRKADSTSKIEQLYIAVCWGVFLLTCAIACVLLIVIVLLNVLRIESPLFLFLPPAYLMSGIAISRPLPLTLIILLVWGFTGRMRLAYSNASLIWSWASLGMLGIDWLLWVYLQFSHPR